MIKHVARSNVKLIITSLDYLENGGQKKTHTVKEGAYNGNPGWSGISASRLSGLFSCFKGMSSRAILRIKTNYSN